jgi:hypothetical protein
MTQLSKCCEAEVHRAVGNQYEYICTQCKESCDVVEVQEEEAKYIDIEAGTLFTVDGKAYIIAYPKDGANVEVNQYGQVVLVLCNL